MSAAEGGHIPWQTLSAADVFRRGLSMSDLGGHLSDFVRRPWRTLAELGDKSLLGLSVSWGRIRSDPPESEKSAKAQNVHLYPHESAKLKSASDPRRTKSASYCAEH